MMICRFFFDNGRIEDRSVTDDLPSSWQVPVWLPAHFGFASEPQGTPLPLTSGVRLVVFRRYEVQFDVTKVKSSRWREIQERTVYAESKAALDLAIAAFNALKQRAEGR